MFMTPTIDQLRECALNVGAPPSDDYLESTKRIVGPRLPPARGRPRRPAQGKLPPATFRPDAAESLHGAGYFRTAITSAKRGKRASKRIGNKDNLCVAGVPRINGASVMESSVPDVDATAFTCTLDAGTVE